MEITTLTVGPLQTNCYLLSHSQTNQTIIIDPGEEADFITQEIIQKKLKPTLIFLTHGHFDHVLGSLELKLNFNLPLALHPKDLSLYQKAPQSALHWINQSGAPVPPPDILLSPEDTLPSPFSDFTVIHTPGHTPGGVSLYSSQHNLLFSGDTLFHQGVGRTDFSYSSSSNLKNPSKNSSSFLLKPKSIPVTANPLPSNRLKNFLKILFN